MVEPALCSGGKSDAGTGEGGTTAAELTPSVNTSVQPWGQCWGFPVFAGLATRGDESFLLLGTCIHCFETLKQAPVLGPRLESFEPVDGDSRNAAKANPYISNTLSDSMFCGKGKCCLP